MERLSYENMEIKEERDDTDISRRVESKENNGNANDTNYYGSQPPSATAGTTMTPEYQVCNAPIKQEPGTPNHLEFALCIEPLGTNDNNSFLPPSGPGIHGNQNMVPRPGPGIHGNPGIVISPQPGILGNADIVSSPGPGNHGNPGIVTAPGHGNHGNLGIMPPPGPGYHGNPGIVSPPGPGNHGNPGIVPPPGPGNHGNPGIVTAPGHGNHRNSSNVLFPGPGYHGNPDIMCHDPARGNHGNPGKVSPPGPGNHGNPGMVPPTGPGNHGNLDNFAPPVLSQTGLIHRNSLRTVTTIANADSLIMATTVTDTLALKQEQVWTPGANFVIKTEAKVSENSKASAKETTISPGHTTVSQGQAAISLGQATISQDQASILSSKNYVTSPHFSGPGVSQASLKPALPISTQPNVIDDVTDYGSYEERRWIYYSSLPVTRGRDEVAMDVSSSEEEEGEERAGAGAGVAQQPESGVESDYLSETDQDNPANIALPSRLAPSAAAGASLPPLNRADTEIISHQGSAPRENIPKTSTSTGDNSVINIEVRVKQEPDDIQLSEQSRANRRLIRDYIDLVTDSEPEEETDSDSSGSSDGMDSDDESQPGATADTQDISLNDDDVILINNSSDEDEGSKDQEVRNNCPLCSDKPSVPSLPSMNMFDLRQHIQAQHFPWYLALSSYHKGDNNHHTTLSRRFHPALYISIGDRCQPPQEFMKMWGKLIHELLCYISDNLGVISVHELVEKVVCDKLCPDAKFDSFVSKDLQHEDEMCVQAYQTYYYTKCEKKDSTFTNPEVESDLLHWVTLTNLLCKLPRQSRSDILTCDPCCASKLYSPLGGECEDEMEYVTTFWNALEEKKISLLWKIISAAPNVLYKVKEETKFRALNYCLSEKNYQMAIALLFAGANVEEEDRLGWSALFNAVKDNDLISVKLLLAWGAKRKRIIIRSPEATTNALIFSTLKGFTPLKSKVLSFTKEIPNACALVEQAPVPGNHETFHHEFIGAKEQITTTGDVIPMMKTDSALSQGLVTVPDNDSLLGKDYDTSQDIVIVPREDTLLGSPLPYVSLVPDSPKVLTRSVSPGIEPVSLILTHSAEPPVPSDSLRPASTAAKLRLKAISSPESTAHDTETISGRSDDVTGQEQEMQGHTHSPSVFMQTFYEPISSPEPDPTVPLNFQENLETGEPDSQIYQKLKPVSVGAVMHVMNTAASTPDKTVSSIGFSSIESPEPSSSTAADSTSESLHPEPRVRLNRKMTNDMDKGSRSHSNIRKHKGDHSHSHRNSKEKGGHIPGTIRKDKEGRSHSNRSSKDKKGHSHGNNSKDKKVCSHSNQRKDANDLSYGDSSTQNEFLNNGSKDKHKESCSPSKINKQKKARSRSHSNSSTYWEFRSQGVSNRIQSSRSDMEIVHSVKTAPDKRDVLATNVAKAAPVPAKKRKLENVESETCDTSRKNVKSNATKESRQARKSGVMASCTEGTSDRGATLVKESSPQPSSSEPASKKERDSIVVCARPSRDILHEMVHFRATKSKDCASVTRKSGKNRSPSKGSKVSPQDVESSSGLGGSRELFKNFKSKLSTNYHSATQNKSSAEVYSSAGVNNQTSSEVANTSYQPNDHMEVAGRLKKSDAANTAAEPLQSSMVTSSKIASSPNFTSRPHVREKVLVKSPPQSRNICPVCKARSETLMMHVYDKHLPWYFSIHIRREYPSHFQTMLKCQLDAIICKVNSCDSDQQLLIHKIIGCLIHDFLKKLMNWLVLEGDLESFLEYVKYRSLHPRNEPNLHSDVRFPIDAHKKFTNDITSSFTVAPPSCVSSLAHWWTLAKLLERLGDKGKTSLLTYEKETAFTIERRLVNVLPMLASSGEDLKRRILQALERGEFSKLWQILQSEKYPNKAKLDIGDPKQTPVILHALLKNRHDCATALILHGASVNQTNNLGESPLIHAVKTSDHIGVCFLKLWGPLNQLSEAIELAKKNRSTHIYDILIKYQQKCKSLSQGRSPMPHSLPLKPMDNNELDDALLKRAMKSSRIIDILNNDSFLEDGRSPSLSCRHELKMVEGEQEMDIAETPDIEKTPAEDQPTAMKEEFLVASPNLSPKQSYKCPICKETHKTWSQLQEHVCTVHLPWYIGLKFTARRQTTKSILDNRLLLLLGNLTDERKVDLPGCFKHCLGRLLHGFLLKCAKSVNLKCVTDLVSYVTKHELYPKNVNCTELPYLDSLLIVSHRYYLNSNNDAVNISPPGSRSGLLHWYTLANIISKLPRDFQESLKVYEKYTHKNLFQLRKTKTLDADNNLEIAKVALHFAIVAGDLVKVEKDLESFPRLVNEHLDKDGNTALHVAIRSSQIGVATLLLLCQASVDKVDGQGNTPLYIANKEGNSDAVMLLIFWGATKQRRDCLDDASIQGHRKIMDILMKSIEKHFEQNVKDETETVVNRSIAEASEICILCCEEMPSEVSNIRAHVIQHHLPWFLSVLLDTPKPERDNCTRLSLQLGPSIRNMVLTTAENVPMEPVYKIWGRLIEGFLQRLNEKLKLPCVGFLVEYVRIKQLYSKTEGGKDKEQHWSRALLKYHSSSCDYHPANPRCLTDVLHWRTLYNLLLRISPEDRRDLLKYESYIWRPEDPFLPDVSGDQPQPNIRKTNAEIKGDSTQSKYIQENVNTFKDAVVTLNFPAVSRIINNHPEIVRHKIKPSNEGIIMHFVSMAESNLRNSDMIRLLLLHGAPIDAIDNYGMTALHKSLVLEKKEFGELLVAWGASLTIRSQQGYDAAALASTHGMKELLPFVQDGLSRSRTGEKEGAGVVKQGRGGFKEHQGDFQEDAVYCPLCRMVPENGKMRDHMFKHHLPWYTWLSPSTSHLLTGKRYTGLARVMSSVMESYPRWDKIRCINALISQLLNNLLYFLSETFEKSFNAAVKECDSEFLNNGDSWDKTQVKLIRIHQIKHVGRFHMNFQQPNCYSAYLHWRWLGCFLQRLQPKQQTEFRNFESYTPENLSYICPEFAYQSQKMLKFARQTFKQLIKEKNLQRLCKFVNENCSCLNFPFFPNENPTFTTHPIAYICEKKSYLCLLILHLYGADLDTVDSNTNTALLCAVMANDVRAVETLLDLGADPNKANHQNQTPLSIAKKENYVTIARCLIYAGASCNTH